MLSIIRMKPWLRGISLVVTVCFYVFCLPVGPVAARPSASRTVLANVWNGGTESRGPHGLTDGPNRERSFQDSLGTARLASFSPPSEDTNVFDEGPRCVATKGDSALTTLPASTVVRTAELQRPSLATKNEVRELYDRAEAHWKAKRWDAAVRKLHQLTRAYPDHPLATRAHLRLGDYYKDVNALNDAPREYEAALAAGGREADEARVGLARLRYLLGDMEGAWKRFAEVARDSEEWDLVKRSTFRLKELDRLFSMQGRSEASNRCGPRALVKALQLRGDVQAAAAVESRAAEIRATSLADLRRLAEEQGKPAVGLRLRSSSALERLQMPVVVHFRPYHFVVVKEIDDKNVRVWDPDRGDRTLTRKGFRKQWSGAALSFEQPPDGEALNLDALRRIQGGHDIHGNTLGGPGENSPSAFDNPLDACGPGMPSIFINIGNYNLIVEDTDFAFGSLGPSVVFRRCYNADDSNDGPFGRSWTFSYGARADLQPDGSVNVRHECGKVDYFTSLLDAFQPPFGVHDELVQNPDGSFTLRLHASHLLQHFASDGRLEQIEDRNGNAVTLQYDASDRLISVRDAVGRQLTLGYGSNGRVETLTDPLSRVARFTYDSAGNLVETVDAAGQVARFTYNAMSYLDSVETPQGTWQIENDFFAGDLGYVVTALVDPLGRRTTYEQSAVATVTDPRGNEWIYLSGFSSETYEMRDPLGNVWQRRFNSAGDVVRITDPTSHVVDYSYDTRGNLTAVSQTVTGPGGPEEMRVDLQYDAADNVIATTNPEGRQSNFTYDGRDNLVEILDPASPQGQITFQYDVLGQLTGVTDARGNTTTYDYDAAGNGNLECVHLPAPGGSVCYGHDAVGRITSRTNVRAQTIGYEYDGIDRLKKITPPDAPIVQYSYNCCGVDSVSDSTGRSVTFAYDEALQLRSYVDVFGNTIGYDYDPAGNLESLTYPDGKQVQYGYDAANRLISVLDWLGNRTRYVWGVVGELRASVSPGGISAYRYDDAHRLTRLLNAAPDGSLLAGYRFRHDVGGRIEGTTVFQPLTPSLAPGATDYSYAADDQILSIDATPITHDADGNLTATGSLTFEYDARNRFTEGSFSGTTIEYDLDPRGQRVGRKENGVTTRFVLDPLAALPRRLAETDGAGVSIAHYVHGLGPIARIDAQTDEANYYHYDAIGNAVALTRNDGALTASYAYDVFGSVVATSGVASNRFLAGGQFGMTDEGSGVTFARARLYLPDLGRFNTRDPIDTIPGAVSAYLYALDDPVSFVDPLGLAPPMSESDYLYHIFAGMGYFDLDERVGRFVKRGFLNVAKGYVTVLDLIALNVKVPGLSSAISLFTSQAKLFINEQLNSPELQPLGPRSGNRECYIMELMGGP